MTMTQILFVIIFLNLLSGLIFYRSLRRSKVIYFVQFIPLAIAAAQGISQLSRARKQKKAAADALKHRNPALDAATNSANNEANATRYAGQDIAEQNIRQGVADAYSNVTRATRSSADAVNAAARLQSAQQRAYQGVAQNNAAFRQNAADKYRGMLLRQAGLRDENRQYSETLKGAAAQNQYNALNSVLGGVAMTNWGGMSGAGTSNGWNYTPKPNVDIGNGQMSGWGMNPNQFSSYKWNPSAFSAGGSFR